MVRRGANTERGKAAPSLSALKQGLRSEEAVIAGESPADWQRHLDGIFESCHPEVYLEEEIARLIAQSLRRRRRLERYEVESITAHIGSAEEDLQIAQALAERTLSKGELPDVPAERVQASRRRRVLPPDTDLDKIMRYRAAEHRQLSNQCTSSKRSRPATEANAHPSPASTSPARRPNDSQISATLALRAGEGRTAGPG